MNLFNHYNIYYIFCTYLINCQNITDIESACKYLANGISVFGSKLKNYGSRYCPDFEGKQFLKLKYFFTQVLGLKL